MCQLHDMYPPIVPSANQTQVHNRSQPASMSSSSSNEEDERGNTPPDNSDPWLSSEGEEVPSGPKCSRCRAAQSDRLWINWQRCWSQPIEGADDPQCCLAYPIGLETPVMLALHGSDSFGDSDFWWFFVCRLCRRVLMRGGFAIENTEIRDRYCKGGGKGGTYHLRPTFVPATPPIEYDIDWSATAGEAWEQDQDQPPSPSGSSGSSNPWRDHMDAPLVPRQYDV